MTLPRSVRAVIAATALLAAVSGCSRSDSAQPSTTPSTRPLTLPPTNAPTTTSATSAAPTTTVLDDEAAIRAVHTRFMTEFQKVDEVTNGPEAVLPLAELITTGPLLERIKEAVQRSLDTGERLVGNGYESNIVDVLIDGDTGSVLDCSLGTGVLYSADGDVLVPASTGFRMRETRLARIGDRWLIEEFVIGGGEQCDPAA